MDSLHSLRSWAHLVASKIFIPISIQSAFTVSSQCFFGQPRPLLPCTLQNMTHKLDLQTLLSYDVGEFDAATRLIIITQITVPAAAATTCTTAISITTPSPPEFSLNGWFSVFFRSTPGLTRSSKNAFWELLKYGILHSLSVSTRRHLRSAGQGDLVVPRTRTTGSGPRSFSVAGPLAWNSLPLEMKTTSLTLGQFSSRLKTEMFLHSYYSSAQPS